MPSFQVMTLEDAVTILKLNRLIKLSVPDSDSFRSCSACPSCGRHLVRGQGHTARLPLRPCQGPQLCGSLDHSFLAEFCWIMIFFVKDEKVQVDAAW